MANHEMTTVSANPCNIWATKDNKH